MSLALALWEGCERNREKLKLKPFSGNLAKTPGIDSDGYKVLGLIQFN